MRRRAWLGALDRRHHANAFPERNERNLMFRKFSRAMSAAVAALVLALCCARAQAEGVKLPESAVGAETFVVTTMSIPKLDPASVEAAAKAMMSPSFSAVHSSMWEYMRTHDAMIS